MVQQVYYRPIPAPETGHHRIAGGWMRASRFERLARGEPPVIVDSIPDDVLSALTTPRPALMGITLDQPRLMGIVNATPDSFSDGGTYDPVEQARRLLREGADILDIGGESTRPGAVELPVVDEISRVVPVIRAMQDQAKISIDTRKAAVARAALAAGAMMINDVSGLDFDLALAEVARGADLPICLMHAQGLPEDMQKDPTYGDVILDIYDALADRVRRAEAAGIARDRIVIDPGIGFGKTVAHNLAIIRRVSLYHGLGCPLLLGVSRKRFIGTISGADTAADRVPGTLALTLAAIQQGVQIHRVHDVAEAAQALALWQALFDDEQA